MKMNLKMLRVNNGDCFIITFKDENNSIHNIVIDGGPANAYKNSVKNTFESLNSEGIDLLVLTHTDDDHIGGLVRFFEDCDSKNYNIKKIIYNSPKVLSNYFCTENNLENELKLENRSKDHSYRQAISLENILEKKGILNKEAISTETQKIKISNVSLNVLSPSIEELKKLNLNWSRESYTDKNHSAVNCDYNESVENLMKKEEEIKTNVTNDSSLAFLLEYNQGRILLLGDSNPNVVACSLEKLGYNENNKIKIDFLKVSHHGSKFNTSSRLLKMINCNNFLISTSGTRHHHPNKETLVRILKYIPSAKFYLNYQHNNIFTKQEQEKYNIIYEYKTEFDL
ncbi:MAG: ComEC/Rec2 family competence protein [Clostridium chrysemydis]|uniref:ComEC/Rec2 family competence protein n=1 Tax=Clostridium chrysemydis TaxID=2665504 RepID=UPI003F2CD00C